MFVGITNTPRDYAWGSTSAIAELFGKPVTGEPQAELWLGAHSGSPAVITDPAAVGGATTLEALLDEKNDGARLPFLLKILAAASPLSLQAHPTMAQAAVGFARENALGIALDAPNRNYKDAFHKPEIIFALSDTFDALCGFRSVAGTRELLSVLGDVALPLLERLVDDAALPAVFEWLISRGDGVDELVAAIVAASAAHTDVAAIATVASLAEAYPGDPGILISLLLNRVTLSRGEVLYLPAGNIHAYLDGLGVELMAASDNVLRGGLTPKHVDVPELLAVLDFSPVPVPYLEPVVIAPGVEAFRPDVPDFELLHLTGGAQVALAADAIAICTGGSFTLSGTGGGFTVGLGEAVFVSGEASVLIVGDGELFIATSAYDVDAA